MSVPSRVRIPGMAAPVEIDLMEAGAFVIGNINQKILALDELPQRTIAQRGRGQAMRLRAALGVVLEALLLDRNRGGEKLRFAWVNGVGNPPDAGKIGLAAVGAR